jgi:hypothetical protein
MADSRELDVSVDNDCRVVSTQRPLGPVLSAKTNFNKL